MDMLFSFGAAKAQAAMGEYESGDASGSSSDEGSAAASAAAASADMMRQITAALEAGRSMEEITAAMHQRINERLDSDPTHPDNVALRAATGTVESMRELIEERGADPAARDGEGRTPLMLAAEHANVPVMRLLLDKLLALGGREASEAIGATDPETGFTALHCAAFGLMSLDDPLATATPEHVALVADAVELLLRYADHIGSVQDKQGQTYLQIVAERWEPGGQGLMMISGIGGAPRSPVLQRAVSLTMDSYLGCTALLLPQQSQRVGVLQPVVGAGTIAVELLRTGRTLRVPPEQLALETAPVHSPHRIGGLHVTMDDGAPALLIKPLRCPDGSSPPFLSPAVAGVAYAGRDTIWEVRTDDQDEQFERPLSGLTLRCEDAGAPRAVHMNLTNERVLRERRRAVHDLLLDDDPPLAVAGAPPKKKAAPPAPALAPAQAESSHSGTADGGADGNPSSASAGAGAGAQGNLANMMQEGLLSILCLCSALTARDLGRLAMTAKAFGLPAAASDTTAAAAIKTADKLDDDEVAEEENGGVFLMCGERVQITGLQGAAQHNGRIGTVSVGCEVTLSGLQSAEHNGKEGVVQAFVKAKGRYTVQIKKGKQQGQGSETKGQKKKQNNMNVKAANLEQSGRYTVLLEGVEKPLRVRPRNLIPCRSSNRLPSSDGSGLRCLSLVEANAMMMALNHPLADCVLTGRGPCEPWLRRLALLELLSTPGRDLVFSATGPQMMLANRGSRVTCPDLRSIYKPIDMLNGWQSAVFGPAGHHTAICGGRHYAEIQVLDLGLTQGVFIGVVGEGFDPTKPGPMNRKGGEEASESDVGWMIDVSGQLNHKGGALKHVGGEYPLPWAAGAEKEGGCGMGARGEAFAPGARLGLLVDLRPHRRSVAVYRNGKRVGLVVPSGLRAPMRWAVSLYMEASVRIVKTAELPVDVSDAQHAREAKRTIELVAADESARRFGFTHPTNDSVNDDDTPAAARSAEDLARIRQVERENIAKVRALIGPTEWD